MALRFRAFPTAISGNNVVGHYVDSANVTHGFLYNGSSYTTLDPPGSFETIPTSVSGNNVVGYFFESESDISRGTPHAFLYDSHGYTILDPPEAVYSQAFAIDGNQVVGSYQSFPFSHAFIYSDGVYTTFDNPAVPAVGPVPAAISGDNIVGSLPGNRVYGFLYQPEIPEPSTVILSSIALGTLGLAGLRKRMRRNGNHC